MKLFARKNWFYAAACTVVALSPACATIERDAFMASAGVSASEYSAITPLGELSVAGTLVEARISLPANLYGLVQLRNERGEGIQGGALTDNDYYRTAMEVGWDVGLPLGFIGSIGANFVQADLDVEVVVDGAPLKVAVNREDYGGRLRLARRGEWLSIATDLEISPVEEAVAGIFEVESGRRFGPWSLALRYGQFPEITQGAVLLRYRYGGGGDRPIIREAPLPKTPEDPAYLTFDPYLDGESDSGLVAPALPPPKRPPWFDEKPEPPAIDYVPKTLPDGRPEWADDPPPD